ncbi:hypothetical protein ACFL1X_11800 [Candidatus Hydrogenedentota bacterium]
MSSVRRFVAVLPVLVVLCHGMACYAQGRDSIIFHGTDKFGNELRLDQVAVIKRSILEITVAVSDEVNITFKADEVKSVIRGDKAKTVSAEGDKIGYYEGILMTSPLSRACATEVSFDFPSVPIQKFLEFVKMALNVEAELDSSVLEAMMENKISEDCRVVESDARLIDVLLKLAKSKGLELTTVEDKRQKLLLRLPEK